MVKTICYGKEETWASREDAIREFKDCMRHSEGAERNRYFNILCDLEDGADIAIDREVWIGHLRTVAKVHCMEEFLNKVIPYDCEDCNEGDLDALLRNIGYWLGDQFYIDLDGNWYEEGRRL